MSRDLPAIPPHEWLMDIFVPKGETITEYHHTWKAARPKAVMELSSEQMEVVRSARPKATLTIARGDTSESWTIARRDYKRNRIHLERE